MNKSTYYSYLSLIVAQLVVGANVALMKYVAPLMPVYINLCLRFLLSTLMLGLLQFFIAGTQLVDDSHDVRRLPTKMEWFYLALMALTGGLLFNAFMMEGVQLTSAMSAGIIVSATPALISVFSFLILKERMALHQCAALFLAIFGILVLNLDAAAHGISAERTFLGDFLVFMSIVPEAFYTVLCKLLGTRLKPISIAFLVNGISIFYFLPFALKELPTWDMHLFFQDELWLYVFGIALASAQFYVLWQIGVTAVSAQTAALFTGLMPVGATFAALFYLGETFSLFQMLGMLCVLMSLFTGAGFFKRLFLIKRSVV